MVFPLVDWPRGSSPNARAGYRRNSHDFDLASQSDRTTRRNPGSYRVETPWGAAHRPGVAVGDAVITHAAVSGPGVPGRTRSAGLGRGSQSIDRAGRRRSQECRARAERHGVEKIAPGDVAIHPELVLLGAQGG